MNNHLAPGEFPPSDTAELVRFNDRYTLEAVLFHAVDRVDRFRREQADDTLAVEIRAVVDANAALIRALNRRRMTRD